MNLPFHPIHVASASSSRVTEVEPDAVFCCCSSSADWFNPLCILRYLSAHLNSTDWLSTFTWNVSQLKPAWSFSVDLSHQNVSVCRTTVICMHLNWINLMKLLCEQIPGHQLFEKYSNLLIWHQQSCNGQNLISPPFWPISAGRYALCFCRAIG